MSTRPKIALMTYSMDNRQAKGTALYTRRLIEHLLADNRYEFYLVHYDRVDDPLYKKAHEIIMPQVRLPYATRFVRQLLFFWKYRHNQFDIIHWFQPRLYPFFWWAPARRIVVTAHGAADITAPSYFVFSKFVFNFLMKYFNRSIDACIAVSHFAKEEIVEHYRIDVNRVFVTYNGGGEYYRPLQRDEARDIVRKNYSIDRPYVLDISRLEPHKNVENVVRGYISARQKYDMSQDLVIVGSRGYSSAPVSALIQSSPYVGSIHIISFVEDAHLNAFYSAADVFVFPSLNEGFGLPLVEAMASGVPVVTSNVTSMPEIAGDAALLVDPTDPSNIADSMWAVVSQKELAGSLIQKGLARAELFTWEETAAKTKEIYDILLAPLS